MSQGYRVAILGATGAVGSELLALLEQRSFPLAVLKLLASPRSAGKHISFKGESIQVEALSEQAFDDVDIVLASAGASLSREWAPKAAKAGAVVIDNSSAFRMDAAVPLVVPEVNAAAAATHRGIIANPNCTTILLALAVWPLHQVQPIKRLVVSTYQRLAALGRGRWRRSKLKPAPSSTASRRKPKPFPTPWPSTCSRTTRRSTSWATVRKR